MAKLMKQRARKPLSEARAIGSVSWRRGEKVYRIDLNQRHGSAAHDYWIELSRVEMLQAMSTWIEQEASEERTRCSAIAKASAPHMEAGE